MREISREISTVLTGMSYLECPRWHEPDLGRGLLYAPSGFGGRGRLRPSRRGEVPGQPSGLGSLPDGRLLVVSLRDHVLLRREADG